ncbi:MAG: hypothetical protein B6241_02660 [Spirochaetaceae bacterium 4572_59]|nr:MAG: hypothetical protein B6241_02660 [Spirochaetaceae bacterium 4572_59]
MKVKNKLILSNLLVFTLFTATFFLFYFSTIHLMELKDLQRETKQLRSAILRYQYANNALLTSRDTPIDGIEWLYNQLDRDLDTLAANKNLSQLDELTAKKIRDNYGFLKDRDFFRYYNDIHSEIIIFKPEIKNISIEMVYQNWINGITIDYDLYKRIIQTRFRIDEYINWYLPFAEQFKTITDEIYQTINIRIKHIFIQTGIALIISLIISITVILFFYSGIIRRIRNVRQGIEMISSGNLRTHIEIDSKDELATMGENFNNLSETIWKKLSTIGEIIHDVGQSLTQDPDSAHLENTILQLAIDNTQADSGAFYKPDPSSRVLRPVHTTGSYSYPYDDKKFRDEIPYGKTILGMAAVSGEPYFVKEPEGQNLIPNRTIQNRNYISSCIVLPLVSEKEVVGIICLEKNNNEPNLSHGRFKDIDFSNILSFIEFSAVTLRNLEKYSELLNSTGLKREMQIASDIQKSLLPPRIPKVPNLDIAVNTYSAKGISGDIYDFFPVNQGKWLFCMAEVKEMGIASSMMLVILRTLLRILVRPDQDMAELMTILHENFRETTGIDTKISINLCLMEPRKKHYSYSGTEGQQMLVYNKMENSTKLLKAELDEKGAYTTQSGCLNNNDSILLLTDGFYKSKDSSGAVYGWSPIQKILQKYSNKDSLWIQEAISKDITYFERDIEQHDDRTMFIAEYKE